jgi:hypothetical protein
VRKELYNLVKEMYVGLQLFQKQASKIMEQLEKNQAKNMEFNRIWEGMNEINQWIEDNPNS